MADTLKNLLIGAAIGAAATGGTVIPLTGEQYKEGAEKVTLSTVAVPTTYRWVDKATGAEVTKAEDAKAEYVPVEQVVVDDTGKVIDTKTIPKKDVRLDSIPAYTKMPDAPRIRANMIAGKKYEVQLLEDGKIAAVAEMTPEENLAALIKMTVYRDVVGTAESEEVK